MAQTEVRQDGADYNRSLSKWKDFAAGRIQAGCYYRRVPKSETPE